jgi:hypothetical protein
MPNGRLIATVASVTLARIQREASRLALGGLALVAACLVACNSDEVPRSANDETTEGGETTGPEETGEESTEDTGPPPDRTCRDGIQCLLACATMYPANPTPEDPTLEDFFLACFLDCGKDLDAQESLAMINLVSCISDNCYGDGSCGGDATDDECSICFAAGLLDKTPPGCEAEGEACK